MDESFSELRTYLITLYKKRKSYVPVFPLSPETDVQIPKIFVTPHITEVNRRIKYSDNNDGRGKIFVTFLFFNVMKKKTQFTSFSKPYVI